MDFKNNYLKPALSLMGGHFLSIVLCFLVFIGLIRFGENLFAMVIYALVLLLIYSFTIYSTMWTLGHGDLNKQNFNRIKNDKAKGFKVALLALSPILLASLVFFVSEAFSLFDMNVVYRVLNVEILPLILMINKTTDYSLLQLIPTVLLSLIPIGLAGLFYIMGNNDYDPIHLIVYKKPKSTAAATRPAKKK